MGPKVLPYARPDPAEPRGLWRIFWALRGRNYRLFFCGQLVSLIGTWLTNVATAWLVYRLTGDPFMLGMVSFAGQFPALLLAPFAGVLVDRWDQRRTLVATQIASSLQSAALAALTLSDTVTIPWILVLYVTRGLINAIDIPCRQAFVFRLVEKREDLPNAIALNSAMFNSARLLGPSIAGVLIAAFGEGVCFAVDAASYLGVIVALLAIRLVPRPRSTPVRRVLVEFREGLRYAFGTPAIRMLLINLGAITMAAVPYTVLMPVFVRDVLHGGPKMLGVLMAANGVGAMLGGLHLATRRSVAGLGPVIPVASTVLGATLIIFSFSHTVWVSAPLLAVGGFCFITQTASTNTLLQSIIDDDKRGRVMSLFGMAFQGTMPLGALLAGTLATPTRLGAAVTVMLGGVGCLLAAAVFVRRLGTFRRHVHRAVHRRERVADQAAAAPVPPASPARL